MTSMTSTLSVAIAVAAALSLGCGDAAGVADAGPDDTSHDVANDAFVLGEALPVVDTGDDFTLFRSDAFPTARCMDGSASGVSVRINPGATGLLLHIQGGGLCIDAATCGGVRNRNGFTREEANIHILTEAAAVMNRGDVANPARDFHHVYIHYCSGDFHAGNNPEGFEGTINQGRANTEAFVARIAPTFSDGPHRVSTVLLSGSSAGALAILHNYPLIQQAFGDIPVHALIDAAPVADNVSFRPCQQQYFASALAIDDSLTPGCVGCGLASGNLEGVLTHLVDTYPDRRFGWFSASEDAVLRCLAGNAGGTCAKTTVTADDYRAALVRMRARLASRDNFKTYFYPSNLHTALFYPTVSLSRYETQGVQLGDWVSGLLTGSSSWDHVRGEDQPNRDDIDFVCP